MQWWFRSLISTPFLNHLVYNPRGLSVYRVQYFRSLRVNTQRASAVMVIVLWSVCLCVCPLAILALQATRRPMSDTNGFGQQWMDFKMAILLEPLCSRVMAWNKWKGQCSRLTSTSDSEYSHPLQHCSLLKLLAHIRVRKHHRLRPRGRAQPILFMRDASISCAKSLRSNPFLFKLVTTITIRVSRLVC